MENSRKFYVKRKMLGLGNPFGRGKELRPGESVFVKRYSKKYSVEYMLFVSEENPKEIHFTKYRLGPSTRRIPVELLSGYPLNHEQVNGPHGKGTKISKRFGLMSYTVRSR
jgi:hypothetical protein